MRSFIVYHSVHIKVSAQASGIEGRVEPWRKRRENLQFRFSGRMLAMTRNYPLREFLDSFSPYIDAIMHVSLLFALPGPTSLWV